MDSETIISFVVVLLLFAWIDVVIIVIDYHNYIKKKLLEDTLYHWKGTNKSKKWLILWSIVMSLNLIVISIPFMIYRNVTGVKIAFFLGLSYSFIIGVASAIIQYYIRYFYEKSEREEDPQDQEKKE